MRAAYIAIVKLVHPDSGHPEASAEKFAEVDNAFRILQAKYAKERRGIKENLEIQEHDIKVKGLECSRKLMNCLVSRIKK